MQFLLIDVAATVAVILGYRVFVAFDRHRSQLVTLSRRARTRMIATPFHRGSHP